MVERKVPHHLSSLCAAFVVASMVATILVVPTAKATPTPDCYNLTLTFRIYNSKGQIQFAGTTYSDGGSVTVCASSGTSYAISAVNIATGYGFHEWFTNTNGQFGNPRGSPTVFVAPASPGALSGIVMLILEGGVGFTVPNLFGGYLLYSPGKSAVQGTFRVPAFTYVTPRPGLDPNNEIAIGVGLGGVQGVGWWTVLVSNLPSSGAASMSVQDWVTNGQNGNSMISSQSVPTASPGTQITATISYSGGAVYSSMCGFSNGCRSYSINVGLDLSTAQWFAADLKDCSNGNAYYACHEVPKFSPFTFKTPDPGSQTYPTLVGALLYLRGPGASPPGGDTPIDIVPGSILSSTTFPLCHASSDCTLRVTNNAASSTVPAVAVDSVGNYHLVWVDSRDGNNEIYYRKLDPNWNVLVGDTRLTSNAYDSISPAIAVSSSGTITVVWADNRGGTYDLWRKQYTSSWGADTLVFDPLYADIKQPDVSVDPGGNVYIIARMAWRGGTESEDVDLFVNFGNPIWVDSLTANGIPQPHSDRFLNPRVVAGPTGTAHIAYSRGPAYPVETGTSYMNYSKYSGGAVGGRTVIGTNFDVARYVYIDADTIGHVYYVWSYYGNGFDVAFRKSDDGGSTWAAEIDFGTGSSYYQVYPDVSAGALGKVSIVWQDNSAGQYEINYVGSGAYGNSGSWSGAVALTQATGDSSYARIATDSVLGKPGVVWQDYRDGNWEIYFVAKFL